MRSPSRRRLTRSNLALCRGRHPLNRTRQIHLELLEPRWLLAHDIIPPAITVGNQHVGIHELEESEPAYRIEFTSAELHASEGMGSFEMGIRLITSGDRPLTGDVVVGLTSTLDGALRDTPFYRWSDRPVVRFPAGSLSQTRQIDLAMIDDDVVRGERRIPFGLQLLENHTFGGVVIAGNNPLELALRGNDTLDVVMNGRAPALAGSVGSLRIRVKETDPSAKLQWASKDGLYGTTYTELLPAATFGLTSSGPLNDPARLEFTYANAGITYRGDVLLSGVNRGVVDALYLGRRSRYLVDDDISIPCDEPTQRDLEVFAKGVAYDVTLEVGMQIVGYGYRVDRKFDDSMTGFQAVGLTCGTAASPVLAVRGTEPNETLGLDLLDDVNPLGVGYDQYTHNYADVRGWLDLAHAAAGRAPSITAHSLGGALTQLFAAAYTSSSATRRLRDIVTFNSPGISATLANTFRAARVLGTVRHYIASGDIVSLAGERYIAGGYTMVEETFGALISFDQLNPLKKHSSPMLADVVGPHRKPTLVLKPYATVNWLSSPFFAYSTVDHYALIGTLSLILGIAGTVPCAAGPVFCHPEFGAIPLVLVFRGTSEASRKIIGFYTTGIRILLQNIAPIVTQYQQTGMFEARLPNVELKDPFLGLLSVRATNLKVRVSNSGPYRVVIQGNGRLDALLKVNANFSGNNYIGISDTGLDLVGTISLDTITLVPPALWQITDTVLTINTVQRRVDATATVLYGPQVSFSLPVLGSYSGRVLRQTISGTLTPSFLRGSGQVSILGGAATAEASLELDIPNKELTVRGMFDILAGTVSATSVARGDSNLNLVIGGNGTVKVPAGIRVIGGKTLANSSGKLDYDSTSGVVCASGWGVVPGLSLIYTVRAGFRLCSNSVLPTILGILGGPPIPSLPRPPKGSSYFAPEGSAVQQFLLPSDLPAAAINYTWENSAVSVPIQIQAPDGTIYDEAAIAANPDLEIIDDFGSDKNKVLVIQNPAPGTWTAIVPNIAGLGVVDFETTAGTVEPTIAVTEPQLDLTGPMPQIEYLANDSDSSASVALYFDDDREGFDGLRIADGLGESDGVTSYTWDTSAVPPGEYYVYAVIEDESNPLVISDYSIGRVVVSATGGPAGVASLSAIWTGGDTVRLNWPTAASAQHYSVRYTSDAAGEFYEGAVDTTGPETELSIGGLIPGETYRFRVAAVDEDSRPGDPSPPAVAIVGPVSSIPPAPDEWDVFADPNSLYTAGVTLAMGDVATLVSAPMGASLSASGMFSWSVPLAQSGFSDVVIRIARASGEMDVERRLLFSQAARTGTVAGQVFSDLNADGIRDPLEPGLNGFAIDLLDASNGAILATTVSADRHPGGINDPILDVGVYEFTGLAPGSYQVRITPRTGFDPTDPEESEVVSAAVLAGVMTSANFGQHDVALPTVIGSTYVPGISMSSVSELRIQFSEDVFTSLAVGDLHLLDLGTLLPVDPMNFSLAYDSMTNTATWTFSGFAGGILPAGDYGVTVLGASVADASGNLLDGDSNGIPGGDFTAMFTQPTARTLPLVVNELFRPSEKGQRRVGRIDLIDELFAADGAE